MLPQRQRHGKERMGTLRTTTATSMKTSPQNITLQYRKFLAVRSSTRSRRTMWEKYPKNKLVRVVSEQKWRIKERSRCRLNLKFGDFRSLLCRVPHEYLLKCVPHVQHDY